MEKKIRKNKKILLNSGIVAIVIGIWDSIKTALFYYLSPDVMQSIIDESDLEEFDRNFIRTFVIIVLVVSCLIATLLHVMVGIGAMRESRREKGGWFCMILAGVIVAYNIYALLETFVNPQVNESLDEYLSFFVLSVTALIAMAEIIISSVRLKIYQHRKDKVLTADGE